MLLFSWAPLVSVPLSKSTHTEEMEKLSRLEALLLTAVLENCADQLAILGYIMPVSHEGKTDTSHVCASCSLRKYLSFFFLSFTSSISFL